MADEHYDRPVLEREIKLAAGPGFHLPDLSGLATGVHASEPQTLHLETTYWDTADLRLARWGCSMRFRGGEGWTVKLPAVNGAGPLLERPEINFAGTGRRPAAAAVSLLRAYVRGAGLKPVAHLSTRRSRVRLLDRRGERLLELVDDEVSVLDARRVTARFRELEVEVLPGGDALLQPLLARLQAAGAAPSEQTPKYLRALGPRASAPHEVDPLPAGPVSTAGEALESVLAASVAQLLRHDPGIRAASDPEDIHQARVAVRRLRSQLRTFGKLLDPRWTRELRDELGWLGRELGAARDAEVLGGRLRARIEELPEPDRRAAAVLLQELDARAQRAREDARKLLDGERYVRLLERLVAAANEPPLTDAASEPAADALPALAASPWRRLKKSVKGLVPESPDADLHQARIAAKQARYAAEAVASLGASGAAAFARSAARLQTVLGEHQDAVTAQAWLRANAGSGRRAFVAGELAALERAVALRARRDWPGAWKQLSKKRVTRWLPPGRREFSPGREAGRARSSST